MRKRRYAAVMILMSWTCAVDIVYAVQRPGPAPNNTKKSAGAEPAALHQEAPALIHPSSAQLSALNQEALTLLREGRAPDAASALARAISAVLSSTELEGRAKSRFLYNFGVALQESGRTVEAAEAFLKSRELDPGFGEPVKAMLTLSKRVVGQLPSFDALLETLIVQGDLGGSRAILENVLTKAGSAEHLMLADREIDMLAQFLTAAAVGPGQFKEDWQPLLARALTAMNPRTAAKAQLVAQIYLGTLPVIINASWGHQFTWPWQASSAESQIFSGLLQAVGERVASEGAERSAVALFALSMSSAGNMDAAVHLAALLERSSAVLDPDGGIFEDLISELFRSKGEAYLHRDWPNIFRLHVVLAGIFEQQRRWGNEAEPKSAIFQLSGAIRASENLSMSATAAHEAVPSLRARLGRAYAEAKQPERAIEEYLQATKSYVASGRPEGAETVLLLARRLADKIGAGSQLFGELEERVRVEQRVRASKTEITDSRIAELILAKLAADPDIPLGVLQVESNAGNVIISGEVANEAEAFDIDRLVRSTIGVVSFRQGLRAPVPHKAPVIRSLAPSPVTGSNSRQPFIIYGENLESGANIILRDLAQHQEFPRRMWSSFTSTRVVLNPTFTTDEHLWSVEVINADNLSTGQVQFQVLTPAGGFGVLPPEILVSSGVVPGRLTAVQQSAVDASVCRSTEREASGPAPFVERVDPNPIAGWLGPTRFTIVGANFRRGANVILRDLDEGQVFDHRVSSSFTDTAIVLNPFFTTDQHAWSVEVINCDGASTGEFRFQVVAPP